MTDMQLIIAAFTGITASYLSVLLLLFKLLSRGD